MMIDLLSIQPGQLYQISTACLFEAYNHPKTVHIPKNSVVLSVRAPSAKEYKMILGKRDKYTNMYFYWFLCKNTLFLVEEIDKHCLVLLTE